MESNTCFWTSCGKYIFPPFIEFEIFKTVRISCPWNLELFFLKRDIVDFHIWCCSYFANIVETRKYHAIVSFLANFCRVKMSNFVEKFMVVWQVLLNSLWCSFVKCMANTIDSICFSSDFRSSGPSSKLLEMALQFSPRLIFSRRFGSSNLIFLISSIWLRRASFETYLSIWISNFLEEGCTK